MHAAQVTTWGEAPKYTTVPDPPIPEAGSGMVQIQVKATGLHQLVRSRASGKHYSASTLPHIPGVDGTGVTPDGKQVFFVSMATGGASFAEKVNVQQHNIHALPEGLDPVKAAALANPAMSSWMGLKYRTQNLPKDFNVLIVGATSTSGRIAIAVSRHLGAGKVYGAARTQAKMQGLGLDKTFTLGEYPDLSDVDVVLDYVFGDAVTPLMDALPTGRPIQYVQIGALGGTGVAPISGANLRSKDLTIRGAGPGSWDPRKFKDEVGGILQAVKATDMEAFEVRKLSEVEELWNKGTGDRLVFAP